MTTIADSLVQALADLGVTSMWGVVGDALNPITDAIRQEPRITWMGTRHEEVGAFAAAAQAQLTGQLGVCMGTVGPGSIHLLNGLYDAAKSHAPVLAICGQVPLANLGSDFFQEVNNDVLFNDVALFCQTVTSAEQMPRLLEQAVNAALAGPGVAVLSVPGDVGAMELPKHTAQPVFATHYPVLTADASSLAEAAKLINAASKVTLLVGMGARDARDEVLALAEKLHAPMVITLKGKEGLERDNPYAVGQSGLIGNPASKVALDGCDLLIMIGTDFPYPSWLPHGTPTIQIDTRQAHIGRRIHVDVALVGDAKLTVGRLLAAISPAADSGHLRKSRDAYDHWRARQAPLGDPHFDHTALGFVRKQLDNRHHLIRPEAVAAAVDKHAAVDAIFTSDTGMSTVWLARFVQMSGTRRMLGSYNLGSMANAMPQALGAAQLYPDRQVIAFCGDGGLSMLLGDLITAVSHKLPVKLVVFNNGRLGMVKLEQEQGGIPEFGTILDNPNFAAVAGAIGLTGIRVEDPADLDAAIARGLATPGPVLIDVVTNPDEIALPPHATAKQAWGFAIAKTEEVLESRGQ